MQAVFNFITSIFTKSSSSLLYFACHDVVALIVIQPFANGQPLHVKFRCLSIYFILLGFLPLVVTFRGFPFQTLSRNSRPRLHIGCPNILISTKDR